MDKVIDLIKKNKLIKSGERIAVACSGGKDSMSLLHFLWSHKDELEIDVVAVNVDHGIRENSASDSDFVVKFCEKQGIKVYSFKVNAKQFSEDKKLRYD